MPSTRYNHECNAGKAFDRICLWAVPTAVIVWQGEAPERPWQQKRLLNMEHSRGPALIDNVNMLVERRLQWKRWIDWARDKSFNGCMLHCRRVDLVLIKHRLMTHVCNLRCSCVHVYHLAVLYLFSPYSYHEDEFLWKGSVLAQLIPMISASVPLLSKSSDWVKYCCPIHRLFFMTFFTFVYLALAR